MKQRLTVKVYCISCNGKYWTSSDVRPYMCMACKRKAGLTAESGFTSLSVAPRQVLEVGTCPSCHRDNQQLSNGKCSDCRFYGMSDIDEELSERARRGPVGEFDWVRKQR